MRVGRTLFAEFGANATARELSLALLVCQRSAIKTGDDHFLQFTVSGGQATAYRLVRDDGGGGVLVDGPKPLSGDVTTTVSATEMRFRFDGSAAAAYQIDLVGDQRRWRITVVPVTGTVRVTDVT
jgi:hypothetical protein